MKFGASMFFTDYSMGPAELAVAVEERGFDIVWSPEHSHIPLTDRPARRFGLTRRGRIQHGFFADLVVFDPERVIDNATHDDPRQFPIGIPFVVVNGGIAVDHERCTGLLNGQGGAVIILGEQRREWIGGPCPSFAMPNGTSPSRSGHRGPWRQAG
jgi:N-acyl-D-aspartate/D-glutamate deacylase